MTTFKPIRNQVLVRREDGANRTKGGLYIPENAKLPAMFGTVVATGPGKPLDNGTLREMPVKEGDKVLVAPFGGKKVDVLGDNLFVFTDDEIVGVVEEGT